MMVDVKEKGFECVFVLNSEDRICLCFLGGFFVIKVKVEHECRYIP